MRNAFLAITLLLGFQCCSKPEPKSAIDANLQHIAESALAEQLDSLQADYGTAVIMDVATGEVKAMANLNHNRQSDSITPSTQNYATQWLYEPASTFRLASYIALLENEASPDMKIDCENGRAKIGLTVIVDPVPQGEISLREVFNTSSNIGMVKAIQATFSKKMDNYITVINKLTADTDSVKRAVIPSPPNIAVISLGYGIQVTPMHVLAIYNAVANNGMYLSPAFVTGKQREGTPVCMQGTLSEVRDCLKSENGISVKSSVTPLVYNLGQYKDPDAARSFYAASVGYFPAVSPKYSVYVGIKTTVRGSITDDIALPAFEGIAEKLAK